MDMTNKTTIQKISKGLSFFSMLIVIILTIVTALSVYSTYTEDIGVHFKRTDYSNLKVGDTQNYKKVVIGEPFNISSYFDINYTYLFTHIITEINEDMRSFSGVDKISHKLHLCVVPNRIDEESSAMVQDKDKYPEFMSQKEFSVKNVQALSLLFFFGLIMYIFSQLYRLFRYYSECDPELDPETHKIIHKMLMAYLSLNMLGPVSVYINNAVLSGYRLHFIEIPYEGLTTFAVLYYAWVLAREYLRVKQENDLTI